MDEIHLESIALTLSAEDIRRLLLQLPTGFVPEDGICDLPATFRRLARIRD